jgi:hypothetical protein
MAASDAPRGRGRLLNPRRSAHATIRGYLYQTCLGVLRWLDLQPNEILLCEGDEDLDRFFLNGESVSEQVKAYTSGLSLSDRVVQESLGNFFRSYVTLRRRGEIRKFVFTTTAPEKRKRTKDLSFDLLNAWKSGVRTPESFDAVRSLLEPKDDDKNREENLEAIAWLDSEPNGWKDFMDAIEWSFDAPDLYAIRRHAQNRLASNDETKLLPAEILLERLIVHAFHTSSRPKPEDRILTRQSLSELIEAAHQDLARWAKTPSGERIRTILDELEMIHSLVHDNTASLPPKAPPGKLLTAAYEVIPFDKVRRHEELEFLTTWCEGDERRSVLLLTGDGGSGKTRLMIEWCNYLRHQGWHAGFLKKDRKADELDHLLQGVTPRFIAIDYAETRLGLVEPFLIKLGFATEGEGPKLRLILLARRQADWWDNLSQAGREVEDLLLRSPQPRAITPLLSKAVGERQTAFQVAIEGFSLQLDLKPPAKLHIPDLSRNDFERVLYLHMAALAVLQNDRVETAASALEHILRHEQRFWRNQINNLGLDRTLAPFLYKALELAVAAVTLVGGTKSHQDGKALLERALRILPLQAHHLTTVLNLVRDLYASYADDKGRYIDPLQPDLLGEELVATALEEDHELLERVLDGSSREESYSVLTVLTRLAQRRPDFEGWIRDALHGRLETLAEIALEVAIDTGDPIGFELAAELETSSDIQTFVRIRELCEESIKFCFHSSKRGRQGCYRKGAGVPS